MHLPTLLLAAGALLLPAALTHAQVQQQFPQSNCVHTAQQFYQNEQKHAITQWQIGSHVLGVNNLNSLLAVASEVQPPTDDLRAPLAGEYLTAWLNHFRGARNASSSLLASAQSILTQYNPAIPGDAGQPLTVQNGTDYYTALQDWVQLRKYNNGTAGVPACPHASFAPQMYNNLPSASGVCTQNVTQILNNSLTGDSGYYSFYPNITINNITYDRIAITQHLQEFESAQYNGAAQIPGFAYLLTTLLNGLTGVDLSNIQNVLNATEYFFSVYPINTPYSYQINLYGVDADAIEQYTSQLAAFVNSEPCAGGVHPAFLSQNEVTGFTTPIPSAAAFVNAATTAPATTAPATTQAATTVPATTAPATVVPIATIAPNTTAPTTVPATTQPSTTRPATTRPATTQPRTTLPAAGAFNTTVSTTAPATTRVSTTSPATTQASTTVPATRAAQTSAPTTIVPTTVAPSVIIVLPNLPSLAATTVASTTAPATAAPTTVAATNATQYVCPLTVTQAQANDYLMPQAPASPYVTAQNCAQTLSYYAQLQTAAWPLSQITLGYQTFNSTYLQTLLVTALNTTGNATLSIALAAEVTAAQLSAAGGANIANIQPALAVSQAFFYQYPLVNNGTQTLRASPAVSSASTCVQAAVNQIALFLQQNQCPAATAAPTTAAPTTVAATTVAAATIGVVTLPVVSSQAATAAATPAPTTIAATVAATPAPATTSAATPFSTSSAGVVTNSTTAQQLNCPVQEGAQDNVCYVVDPNRLEAPWRGSMSAFPQCYRPSQGPNDPNNALSHVCTGTAQLCPYASPYSCGSACYNPSQYSCVVNSANFFNSYLVQVGGSAQQATAAPATAAVTSAALAASQTATPTTAAPATSAAPTTAATTIASALPVSQITTAPSAAATSSANATVVPPLVVVLPGTATETPSTGAYQSDNTITEGASGISGGPLSASSAAAYGVTVTDAPSALQKEESQSSAKSLRAFRRLFVNQD